MHAKTPVTHEEQQAAREIADIFWNVCLAISQKFSPREVSAALLMVATTIIDMCGGYSVGSLRGIADDMEKERTERKMSAS